MIEVSIAIIGLFLGSFLNLLADRLPVGRDVLFDRSRCDGCNKTLRWYELIPVFSYIALGAKCPRCGHQLSVAYPLSELMTACVGVVIWRFYPDVSLFLPSAVIAASVLVILWADIRYQIIPDSMVITGILGVIWRLYADGRVAAVMPNHVMSAIGASMFFYMLWYITRGRGIGFGDVKFAFFMGLGLGFPGIIIALYAAFLTGAAVGVILILGRKKSMKSAIAFGPFLIAGTAIAYIWGGTLWNMYFNGLLGG